MRPAAADPPRVAVVGAGLAGLACARTLHDCGLAVTLFDRGRAPGGRLATRRRDGQVFDHGAQYFTTRDERFARVTGGWASDGVVARWAGRLVARDARGVLTPLSDEPRWVGVPGMAAIATHLARDLDVQSATVVTRLHRGARRWRLHLDGGADAGEFEVVLVAAQGPRAAELLAPVPSLAARAASARLAPCLAVMAAHAESVDAAFDGATIAGSPLAWVARDSSKPRRPPGDRWVLHATPAWSAAHLADPPEAVATVLRQAFRDVVGRPLPALVHCETRRWSHALVTVPVGDDCLWDATAGAGACGDWCLGGRVEAAYLSGVALAARVLDVCRPRSGQAPRSLSE